MLTNPTVAVISQYISTPNNCAIHLNLHNTLCQQYLNKSCGGVFLCTLDKESTLFPLKIEEP